MSVEDGDIIGWEFKMEKESLEANSRSYKIHLEMLDADDEHPIPCLCGTSKCEIIRFYLNEKEQKEAAEDEDGVD